MTVFRTMCPMNCHPTLCGMLVDVEDGRVTGVRGDPDNPDSQGFLCIRGQASREILGNPKRLLHPLIRVARGRDEWRQATWEEALDLIVARMRGRRPRRGRRLVGARAVRQQLRHPRGLAPAAPLHQPVRRPVVEPHDDLLGARRLRPRRSPASSRPTRRRTWPPTRGMIVLWGANLASQPNTGRHLAAARRRGAHVVTIDVRETEAAAQSDETLLVRPGSDAALALALLHVIVAEKLWDRDVRRAPHGRLRGAGRPRGPPLAGVGGADHRGAGRAHRRAGPPLRHDARRR